MLLAYLPFMAYPFGFFKTCVAAFWIVAFLWLTVFFFWFTRRFFPGRSLRPAFFLWLIVWAQAAWTLTRLPPLWIVSVFFLAPVSFLENETKAARVRIFSKDVPGYFLKQAVTGIAFAGFAALLSLAKEIAEKNLGVQAFEQPAGALLVIAAAAFLWKNQPFRKKE